MKKLFLLLSSAFLGILSIFASAHADLYVMTGAVKSSLGGASKDIADSLMQGTGDLLNSFSGLIVVGFLIGVIFYFVKRR